MKKIAFILTILLIFGCGSTSQNYKDHIPPKYKFIVDNFKLGKHKINENHYKLLPNLLKVDTYGNHQFALEFYNNNKMLVWWVNDPEFGPENELKGNWTIYKNIITMENVGRYSGKYRIIEYELKKSKDYRKKNYTYHIVITFDKKIGIDGWEDYDMYLSLDK